MVIGKTIFLLYWTKLILPNSLSIISNYSLSLLHNASTKRKILYGYRADVGEQEEPEESYGHQDSERHYPGTRGRLRGRWFPDTEESEGPEDCV